MCYRYVPRAHGIKISWDGWASNEVSNLRDSDKYSKVKYLSKCDA